MMNIDISQIEFEERVDNEEYDSVTFYFIGPKELVADKYPDAEHTTISIECTHTLRNAHVMISPTKSGMDYDWCDVDLNCDILEKLILMGIKHNPVAVAYEILVKTLHNPKSTETEYTMAMKEAIGYLGEALE